MNSIAQTLVKDLVLLLVNGSYSQLIKRCENGRLTYDEIKQSINDYPGKISLPPDSAYEGVCIYDVYDEAREARKLEFDLWYDDEISDLTLTLDLFKGENGKFKVVIDDIHVL